MKRIILIIGLLIGFLFSHAQNVTGNWNGTLKINENNIKLQFNIKKKNDSLISTFSSTTSNFKDFETSSTVFNQSILTISMENVGMRFQGRLMKNNTIMGVFTQMGKLYPLLLVPEKTN